jgi:hypothetical protein
MKQHQLLSAVSVLLVAATACADAGNSIASPGAAAPSGAKPGAAGDCSAIYHPTVGHPLLALRDEAMNLRQADGGTLTREHLTYLRNKLAEINKGNCK